MNNDLSYDVRILEDYAEVSPEAKAILERIRVKFYQDVSMIANARELGLTCFAYTPPIDKGMSPKEEMALDGHFLWKIWQVFLDNNKPLKLLRKGSSPSKPTAMLFLNETAMRFGDLPFDYKSGVYRGEGFYIEMEIAVDKNNNSNHD